MRNPVLELTSRCTADAYVFHPVKGADGRRDFGWAICTVNDTTGELLVCSDWGNASHRWPASPENLGHPTLTHFIGERAGTDYMARKLLGNARDEFSAEKTTARLRERLLEVRRDDASAYGADEVGDSGGRSRRGGWSRRPILTRALARELWDALGEIADDLGSGRGEQVAALYFERLPGSIHDHLSDLYESSATEPTNEYRALVGWILPALVKACAAEVAKRAANLATAYRPEVP